VRQHSDPRHRDKCPREFSRLSGSPLELALSLHHNLWFSEQSIPSMPTEALPRILIGATAPAKAKRMLSRTQNLHKSQIASQSRSRAPQLLECTGARSASIACLCPAPPRREPVSLSSNSSHLRIAPAIWRAASGRPLDRRVVMAQSSGTRSRIFSCKASRKAGTVSSSRPDTC
jgi:hypothetical protein